MKISQKTNIFWYEAKIVRRYSHVTVFSPNRTLLKLSPHKSSTLFLHTTQKKKSIHNSPFRVYEGKHLSNKTFFLELLISLLSKFFLFSSTYKMHHYVRIMHYHGITYRFIYVQNFIKPVQFNRNLTGTTFCDILLQLPVLCVN